MSALAVVCERAFDTGLGAATNMVGPLACEGR